MPKWTIAEVLKNVQKRLTFFKLLVAFVVAMSLFASFMVLLLILVEVAPPSAASVPKLGQYIGQQTRSVYLSAN